MFGQTEHTLLSLGLTHIATPSETGGKSLTLLATPSGEPIMDVFMQYIDFKEGMLQSYDVSYCLSLISLMPLLWSAN